MTIVDKYSPKTFSAVATSNGIVLCASDDGAFLVIRFPEEIETLQSLLDSLKHLKPGVEG